MKKYRKCEEIVEILRAIIRERIRNSCYYLPGEIAMSEEIGVSRITLRKAMAILETEGLIRRDRGHTEIVEKRNILSKCGKILFVAGAHHSTIILPAIERLWMKFAPEVINRGGNVELFLVNSTTTAAEWQEKIYGVDVIFLTTCDSAEPEKLDKIIRQAQAQKYVFSLLETISAPNNIYLDNYSVGFMAAHTLARAGCRKVAGISFDYEFFHNMIFARRMQGFRDGLKACRIPLPDAFKLIPYPSHGRFNPEIGDNYSKHARKALDQAYADGCDGVFMASDEEIGLIAMNLFRRNVIPGKLKLLSFNGVGDAMRHNPPISCISHGTNAVVETAIEQLKLIAERRFAGPVNIMVTPKLYVNNTLSSDRAGSPVTGNVNIAIVS